MPLLATASPSYFKSVDQVIMMMMIKVMIIISMIMMVMMMAIHNQVIVAANRVYHDFLASEDGSGFSGQV